MEQLFEFIANHPILVLVFIALVVAIIVTEVRQLRTGVTSVEPGTATALYNRSDAVFIDIRGEGEFRKAHLPGSINVPAASLDERLDKLGRYKNRPIVVYCGNGMQSGRVASRLRKQGFDQVHQLSGGLAAWQAAGFPVEGK